jgi:hypothetical protein
VQHRRPPRENEMRGNPQNGCLVGWASRWRIKQGGFR